MAADGSAGVVGATRKSRAIVGSAVARTVASRFCMKRAGGHDQRDAPIAADLLTHTRASTLQTIGRGDDTVANFENDRRGLPTATNYSPHSTEPGHARSDKKRRLRSTGDRVDQFIEIAFHA